MLPRQTLLAFAGLNALLLAGLALPAPAPGLRLQWRRQHHALEPTWPDQPRFTSDGAFRPVAAGPLVLVTSSREDSVAALAAATGAQRWRFVSDGPVRFAPAAWNGNVYFTSDDGHLYCLDLATGALRWKFRGGPSDRRILGNERLISTWPARGAPAVAAEADGGATVYFAAGIWPFMGVFLYALDARTGEARWQNSGEGSIYIKQPHQVDAFAGIAPQGSLVVAGDDLIVPGGRSTPAVFDRHTGRRKHYRLADASKLGGGPDVVAGAEVYLNGGGGFDLATGSFLGQVGEPAVIVGATLWSIKGTTCRAFDLDARPEPEPEPPAKDAKARAKYRAKLLTEAWLGEPTMSVKVPATTALLAAHGRLYGAGEGVVWAIDLADGRRRPGVVWQAEFDGTAAHLAASEDQLFVSTRDGELYAFGPGEEPVREHALDTVPLPAAPPETAVQVRRILAAAKDDRGYAVVWGAGDVGLVAGLLRQSRLRLVVLDPDARRVARLREALHAAGIAGRRAGVLCAGPGEAQLPPYFASLALVADAEALRSPGAAKSNGLQRSGYEKTFSDLLYPSLRPYGGLAVLNAFAAPTEELKLLRRDGPLPGAADWTHEHANAANTRVSRDQLVKAPLGLLWFGGPGHDGILPRHGHGPVPQVCEGRLFVEGVDKLRAIDIYTGRLLWEASLPGVGKRYDNMAHQPGANALGSNYVSLPDGVFVAHRDSCVQLDPATGKERRRYHLPPVAGAKTPPEWTFLTVAGRYLIGGSGLVPAPKPAPPKDKKTKTPPVAPSRSMRLTVFDRDSGKALFSIDAKSGFRHNAVCVGGGRLYAADLWTVGEGKKKRKYPGPEAATPSRLVAHDLATGRLLWSRARDVFGGWLSYSAKHDVLVEAGMMSRDTLADEPEGMRAYRGRTGQVLWYEEGYFGPALIHGDRVLKGGDAGSGSGTACDLLTGKPIRVPDSLTGEPAEWKWVRTYGCNTPAASEHLLLFRSGAAGFYDLCHDGGTGNLGGFRSSCTLNLIAAGGVLTAPDYTRTCTCSYQNQCSLAFVHMPEAELWTFTTAREVKGPIRRVGINLGAPGSRKADNGTLWLEYPPAGGPSPKVAVTTVPARPETFRLHQSQVNGAGLSWVGASGVRGLRSLKIDLGGKKGETRRYTVRLHFLEPDAVPEGARVFDVAVQGKTVLRRLDVRRKAGGVGRGWVYECKEVVARGEITVALTPAVGAPVLSGVEVVAQDK
jgi:outer membrane protein assembly factor BamB